MRSIYLAGAPQEIHNSSLGGYEKSKKLKCAAHAGYHGK